MFFFSSQANYTMDGRFLHFLTVFVTKLYLWNRFLSETESTNKYAKEHIKEFFEIAAEGGVNGWKPRCRDCFVTRPSAFFERISPSLRGCCLSIARSNLGEIETISMAGGFLAMTMIYLPPKQAHTISSLRASAKQSRNGMRWSIVFYFPRRDCTTVQIKIH